MQAHQQQHGGTRYGIRDQTEKSANTGERRERRKRIHRWGIEAPRDSRRQQTKKPKRIQKKKRSLKSQLFLAARNKRKAGEIRNDSIRNGWGIRRRFFGILYRNGRAMKKRKADF